jgi:hypothetical protein
MKVVNSDQRPSHIKTATVNEGARHIVHLCDDYLTTTDDRGTITCMLVRPLELSVKNWRTVALEYRFSQTSKRSEIMSDLAVMATSHLSRKRFHQLGVWE